MDLQLYYLEIFFQILWKIDAIYVRKYTKHKKWKCLVYYIWFHLANLKRLYLICEIQVTLIRLRCLIMRISGANTHPNFIFYWLKFELSLMLQLPRGFIRASTAYPVPDKIRETSKVKKQWEKQCRDRSWRT